MGKRYNKYNDTNTCDRCKEKDITTILYPGNALKEYNKEGNWTGNWLCHKCWYAIDYKHRPDSTNNVIKSLANCRTGNVNPDSAQAKGNNFEELSFRWLGAKRLSIIYDKYSQLSLDHLHIPNGVLIKIGDKFVDLSNKIPQTMGKLYSSKYGRWQLGDLK